MYFYFLVLAFLKPKLRVNLFHGKSAPLPIILYLQWGITQPLSKQKSAHHLKPFLLLKPTQSSAHHLPHTPGPVALAFQITFDWSLISFSTPPMHCHLPLGLSCPVKHNHLLSGCPSDKFLLNVPNISKMIFQHHNKYSP